MAQKNLKRISLTSDIVVTWPFSFSGGITIGDMNEVTPNQDGWTIAMPNATLATEGQTIDFNNISGYDFEIIASDLTTSITVVEAGEVISIYLYDSSTSNGLWRVIPYGGGSNAIVSLTAESSSITISNGTVSPPGGTIDFELPESLSNLNKLSTLSFPVITAAAPLEWKTVELVAGENISITDADGIDGEPVINLNPVVTGLSSVEVGSMTLAGSLITSNNVDGNIELNTNGTGAVQINGVSIDINGNLSGINNLTVNGSFLNSLMPKIFCTFTDTITEPTNTIVVEDQVNISSVTGSGGTYSLNFSAALPSINYSVIFSLGSTGDTLPPTYHAYWTVRETTSLTIIVTDASGELVGSVPNGITVVIFSSQ